MTDEEGQAWVEMQLQSILPSQGQAVLQPLDCMGLAGIPPAPSQCSHLFWDKLSSFLEDPEKIPSSLPLIPTSFKPFASLP